MESTSFTDMYTSPSKMSDELIWAQETERLERMNGKVDPIVMGHMFKCQTEMMHKHFGTTLYNDARASANNARLSFNDAATSAAGKMSSASDRASSFTHNLVESTKEAYVAIKDKLIETYKDMDRAQEQFSVDTNNSIKRHRRSLSSSVEEIMEKSKEFSVSTNSLFGDIKDNMTGLDISSAAAEEKERVRRMNEKIDPIVEGKKHRVEEELLSSIKLVS